MHAALRRTATILALALMGPGLFIAPAAAQDDRSVVKIRAHGFAAGQGRDAEAEALADAELAAVDVVLFDLVGDRWLHRLDAVLAQASTYVRTSRPLESTRTADGVEVLAEVYVYHEQLRRDIAAVLFRGLSAKPAVAVLFGEQIEGHREWTVANGTVQRFFEKRFADAGFQVVDAAARYTPEALAVYQAGNARQVAGFGRDNHADIVVRGDATAQVEVQPEGLNVNRVVAKVEIDLIRPADALVVERHESSAAVNSPNPGMGGEQALEDAATKVVQDVLVGSMMAYATEPPAADFVLTVRMPREGPWLTRARKGIGERFPKAQLQDLHHSPGEARFRLALDVPLSTLVRGLTDTAFDEFRFVTERAVGRELDLELVPVR